MSVLLRIFFCALILLVFAPQESLAQRKTKRENFKENHNPFAGRRKERKNQGGTSAKVFQKRKGFFVRKRSAGNADDFAANGHRSGGWFTNFMASLSLNKSQRNASLRKTKPGKVQDREQPRLFHRNASKNKLRHERIHRENRKKRLRKTKRFGE